MADDTSIGISDSDERIEFDGAGDISILGANLGIGTSAPSDKFVVVGGTNTKGFEWGNDSGSAVQQVYDRGTSAYVDYKVAALTYTFQSNGTTTAFTIDSSQVNIPNGGLMIGSTSSPGVLLNVGGATNTWSTADLLVKDSGAGGIHVTDNTKYVGVWAQHGGGSHDGSTVGTRSTHDFSLMTADTKALTIDTSQNVGIGTTSPVKQVHIKNWQDADTTLMIDNQMASGNSSAGAVLALAAEGGNYDPKVTFGIGNSGADWAIGVDNSNNDSFVIAGGTDATPALETNPRLTIDGSGNVGIGTTDPSAALDVVGSAYFSGPIGIGRAPSGTIEIWAEQAQSNEQIAILESSHATTPQGIVFDFSAASPDDNTQYFLKCSDSTANRLFIYSDGDVLNSDGTYGTISDERMKSNMTPARRQWDDVKWLGQNAINYTMGSDRELLGWGAQTVREAGMGGLVMECREGEDDAHLSLRSSVIHTKAVIALSEAMARIEALEAALAEL